MSNKNKNKNSIKFKEKEIDYPEENPLEELMQLYDETDEKNGIDMEVESGEKEKDFSLKQIIEKSRKKRKKSFFIILILILLLSLVAAVAGFLFFSQQNSYKQENIELNIVGPEKIKVGETVEYVIDYKNIGETNLTNCKLNIQYPHGFILEKTEPASDNHHWLLSDLAPFDKGEIKIVGKIIDNPTIEQKLSLKLDYYPENFNAEFSKEQAYSSFLEVPQLNILNDVLSSVSLGQTIDLNTKIENKEDYNFENIKLIYNFPEGFDVLSATPEAFEDNNKWLLVDLNSDSEAYDLNVEGVFADDLSLTSDEDRERKFSVDLALGGIDDQYYIIKSEEYSIKITDQAVNAYLIVNGKSNDNNVNLGQNLTFSIGAKNNGLETYEDVGLKVLIDTKPYDILDWTNIDDENLGKIKNTDNGKEIIWTSRELTELAEFKPDDEIFINLILPVKNLDDLSNIDINNLAQTTINTVAVVDLSPNSETVPEIKSSQLKLQLNSNVSFNTSAIYYFEDGTPIGSGPMPPKADQETQLMVFWQVKNDLHELSDIQVTTTLPENISWQGLNNVSAGELNYNEATREISWKINRLPKSVTTADANFAIVLKPKLSDVGKLMKLTGITTFSAKDNYTQDIIVKTNNILTSALEADIYAEGEGIVEP